MNIVIAGIYRSGSTWLYNAVRFMCEEAGKKTKGSFIWEQAEEEFELYDCNVVKTHCHYQDYELYFEPDIVITSVRNESAIIKSMKAQREKGIEPQFKNAGAFEKINLFHDWLNLWRKHSKHVYEMNYKDLERCHDLFILVELNKVLGFELDSSQYVNIMQRLEAMVAPLSGYDKQTLLTPTHPNK